MIRHTFRSKLAALPEDESSYPPEMSLYSGLQDPNPPRKSEELLKLQQVLTHALLPLQAVECQRREGDVAAAQPAV